jgi:type IV secretion system protein VirB10
MKSNQVKKEDGLPEVAQRLREKRPIVFVMIGLILIAGVSVYWFGKPAKKAVQTQDESYSPQQSNEAEVLKAAPIGTQPAHAQPSNTTGSQSSSQLTQEQVALIQAKQNELQQRLSAPLMLVNTAQQNKTETPSQASTPATDRNTQFMNQVSAQTAETATATTIGPLNSLIAEGSLIHAILEPATNSDLPGFVRAIVSEPGYSEDGSAVLIPRGSRLIGQYKSGMLQGQSRIFMVWTRLITPSGISIQLGSPGVDGLGVAGIGADEVDRHFWQRFGTASLLSIIGTGAANAGVSGADQENSASAYRSAMATSFSQSANESLQQDSKTPPTLTTYQGKPIMVFVAKDLNFKNATQQSTSKVNVF